MESGDSVTRPPLGIFRFGLAPAGIAGPAGHLEGTHRVASLQCSIFRCDTDTLRRVDSDVNHSIKLRFIWPGVWFALTKRGFAPSISKYVGGEPLEITIPVSAAQ